MTTPVLAVRVGKNTFDDEGGADLTTHESATQNIAAFIEFV